jgi:uncharacterized protein
MPAERPVALVTGASSGIGAALADRLAHDGFDLVVVARRRERLVELAERLQDETGAEVQVVVADLSEPEELRRVEELTATHERLSLLVNNAGFSGYGPFADIDPETLQRLIGVHVLAPARLCRAALPGMIARGHGALVNVASLLALSGPLQIPMRGHSPYAGAKSFLLTFTQALASEIEGTGVQAMVCLPGIVESEFHGPNPTWRAGLPILSSPDVAQAILAGLERREVVCVPALEDADVFDRLRDLQQAALRGGNGGGLAERYRRD